MARKVLPGTLQIRVIADKDETEEVSKRLINFLESEAMEVVECTPDFVDRFDDGRRKFHITAIPSKAKLALVTPGGN